MDNVPPLPPSRQTILLRALCSLLFCTSVGLLALVLSFAVWVLRNDPDNAESPALLAAFLLIPLLSFLGFVLCLSQRIRAQITLPGFLIGAGLLVFLAADDFRRSDPPNYGPVAAPDSAEFLTYMQMAEGTPDNLTQQVAIPAKSSDQLIATDPQTWQKFIEANYDQILREWEEDEVGQSWLIDMADLPDDAGAIVHTTPAGPIIAFRPVRAAASHRLAYALLLADEGKADEAASHLIILLRAGHTLQRIGVGPLDEMVALAILKKVYAGIDRLLDGNSLSVSARAELTESVAYAPSITLVISRSIIGEAQALRSMTDQLKRGEIPGAYVSKSAVARAFQRFLWRFAYHPYRTERAFLELYQTTNALAATRELEQVQIQTTAFEQRGRSPFALRNPVGHKMSAISAPSFEYLTKLWACEDTRRALLERLKAQPTASAIP